MPRHAVVLNPINDSQKQIFLTQMSSINHVENCKVIFYPILFNFKYAKVRLFFCLGLLMLYV